MDKPHAVILTLDGEQLRLIHVALSALNRAAPDLTMDPPDRKHFFSKLCRLVLLAKDICEAEDKAKTAYEQLQAELDR